MKRSAAATFIPLFLLLLAAVALGIFVGPTTSWDNPTVAKFRATRVLLACIVGSGLATTGAVLQAVAGNPLADPFVLGASSGAAVGYVIAQWLGVGESSPFLFIFTSGGAYVAILLVLWFARIGRRMPVQTLILAGVTVSTLGTAVVLLNYSLQPHLATHAMFFLMGNLEESQLPLIGAAGAIVALCLLLAQVFARALDAFAMGEETARHLGVEVEHLKLGFCLLSSGLVGVIVAVSGLIGFVGLIVPHIARLLVGSNHRRLLPACAFGGATFLIVCDVVARKVLAPQQLSLGAITALCGGPFFLWLLRRRLRGSGGRG